VSGNDILVIPNKYVDELRNMPDEKLSSIQANIEVNQPIIHRLCGDLLNKTKNFEGLYSTTNILLEGTLHTRTIQTRMTPKLASLVTNTQKELKRAMPGELAVPDGSFPGI
jgi:hypothetical protein